MHLTAIHCVQRGHRRAERRSPRPAQPEVPPAHCFLEPCVARGFRLSRQPRGVLLPLALLCSPRGVIERDEVVFGEAMRGCVSIVKLLSGGYQVQPYPLPFPLTPLTSCSSRYR